MLRKDYDLILVSVRTGINSLYHFKNNFSLTVDSKSVESIDFFDISFAPRASKYWSTRHAEYRARTFGRITGYLLFPKIIDENSKNIKLEGDGKSIFLKKGAEWDFEKINELIEIKKN